MATVEVKPFIMKDCLVTLTPETPGVGGDFQKALSQVEFVPTASVVTFKGLSPDASYSFPSSASWAANLSFAQDWNTPESLSRFLFEHEGETVDAIFEPVKGGTSFAVPLVVVPGSIGGTVDAVGVSTVALGCQGRPVPTYVP